MKHPLTGFAVCLFFLAAVTSLSAQHKNSVQGDFEALADLYSTTNGDNWSNNAGWLNGDPSDDWYGVEVNGDGRVISLDLYKNNLTGELPESIGNLTQLRFFSVKRNPIFSQIPKSIGNWVNIEVLLLSSGQDINQPISNNNHPLKTPASGVAKFYGTVPDVFDRMPNLEVFQFEWNKDLDTQPFPSTFYRHPSIRFLSIHGNQFSGQLVDDFDLPNLEAFLPGANNFIGSLPSSLGNSTKLETLKLTNEGKGWVTNNFSGEIPSSYQNLVNLRFFFAWDQDLGGEIPGFVVNNWTNLREFRVSGSNFTGELPAELGNSDLITFTVGRNNFTGSIPDNLLEGMPRIKIFTLMSNPGISGNFPSVGFSTKQQLRTVWLQDLSLSGPLPEAPRYTGDMSIFTMHRNNFEGGIPKSWVNLFIPTWWDPNNHAVDGNGKGRNISIESSGNTIVWSSGSWDGSSVSSGSATIQNDKIHFLYYRDGAFHLTDELEDIGNTSTIKNNVAVITWRVRGEDAYVNSNLRDTNSRRVLNNIQLRGNQLQGILPKWFSGEYLVSGTPDVRGNRWTYRDILENGVDVNYGEQHDAPHLPFGQEQSFKRPIDSIFEFDYSHKIHSTDKIRWSKLNPSTGEWEQDDRFSDSAILKLASVKVSDYGTYRMELYNEGTQMPDWIISEPIIIEEGEGSDIDEGTDENIGSPFPEAPLPSFPANNATDVSLMPDFKWSAVDGADYYILHVSRQDPTGMSIDVTIEETTFTASEILGDETVHDWRVRAVKEGELGEWSNIQRFTTRDEGLPEVSELVAPTHFEQEVDPATVLIWEDAGADSYEIRMYNKKSGEMIFSDLSNVPSYTPVEILPDTTEFIWQIKSVKAAVHSAWGPRWEFSTGVYDYSVEAPSLIAPGLGSEYDNLTPVFEWSDVEADHYVIAVSKEEQSNAKSLARAQSETFVIFDQTTETLYMPDSGLEPDTRYYWRVHAVKDGEEGEWSEMWEFTTPGEQSVSSDQGEQPLQTALAQNYPNPFNPTTQIEFTLSVAQKVSLRVYDMAGRQVATLIDRMLLAGRHTATFNASNLASGIYIYRFTTDRKQYTRKMTLVK